MPIIGEAWIAVRPLMTGFGAATKVGIDKEIAAQDLFGGVRTQGKSAADDVANSFDKSGKKITKDVDGITNHIGSGFKKAGESLGNWGVPFSGSLTKVGQKLEDADTKAQKLSTSMSLLGGLTVGVGAVGLAAVAGESVHLATGLAEADGQIASHENISVKAAANVGKAFESSAGTTIYSANQQSEAFAPISGELAQISGHALTAGQSLQFMSKTGDLAEATGGNLGSTTKAVASIMQGFQVPLKGTTALTNELFNTSRITGVGVDSLGSTIDRLKARLGVAAPTVSDLSSLLVDLNEHGVQGSRGLQVVNTAVNTLLESVPKVSLAAAQQANAVSNSVQSAATSVANAQTRLSEAQTNAATKVTDAQQRVAEAQDAIAASNTASAPTTAQQISLQNAQTALSNAQASASQSVANAQTALSQSQQKAGEVTKTNSLSSNQQVAVMQQLGLQVYNAQGKFVGMRDVIAQLQPKLATMTQQQQLFTLSQIFGSGASKALLDTVLAGPAAYDKASKAVNDSSTAHKGAAQQNQNLGRQLDILKASLIDEGDKLGTFLIPKLEDLAKWTEKDIQFFMKHKDVTLALASAVGLVLTAAVGVFTVNTGAKFLKWGKDAFDNVGKLASGVKTAAGKITGSNQQIAASTEETAGSTTTANAEIASGADEAAAGVGTASKSIGTSSEAMVTETQGAATEMQLSFDAITDGAFAMQEDVQTSFLGVGADADAAAAAQQLAADKMVASDAEIGLGAEGAAGKTLAAGGAEVAGGTVAGGEVAATGLGATAGASSILPAAIAGFVAFKATGDLLHRNVLGLGTATKDLGNVVAGWFGHSSQQDTKKDESKDAKLFTKADIPYLAEIVAGTVKGGHGITKAEAKDALKDLGAGKGTAQPLTSGGLGQQLTVLQQLQATATTALAQHGATSKQYQQAMKDLNSTEIKWFPKLGTEQSTTAVVAKITSLQGAMGAATAHQTALIAKDGTLAAQKTQLAGLDSKLAAQKASGASEATLADTRNQIKVAKDNIGELKTTASHIAKDATLITQQQHLKTSIDAVNQGINRLRQQIDTMPAPKLVGKTTGTFTVRKG